MFQNHSQTSRRGGSMIRMVTRTAVAVALTLSVVGAGISASAATSHKPSHYPRSGCYSTSTGEFLATKNAYPASWSCPSGYEYRVKTRMH